MFDTFAAIDAQQPQVFDWPDTTLAVEDGVHLRRLLSRLLYFGRSESWGDAELENWVKRIGPAWRLMMIATPHFCPIHLTRRSGKRRSLRDQVQESLAKVGVPKAGRIDEIVFDYDPPSLGRLGMRDPRQPSPSFTSAFGETLALGDEGLGTEAYRRR